MKLLLILLAGLFVLPVSAQKVWTLEECVDYALKNNLTVKQSEVSAQMAEISKTQALGNMVPSLNGVATHFYNFGKTIDRYTNTFATERVQSNNFGLSSSVTLFNGLSNYNQLEQSKLNVEASKHDVQKSKYDISLQIISSYLQVLYNQELITISKQQIQLTESQVKRTKTLVDAGAAVKGNLLTIESQLANDQLSLVNAENNLNQSALNLALLLNLDTIVPIKVVRPQIDMPVGATIELNPEQMFQIAYENMPEIKAARLRTASNEKSVSMAKGSYLPTLQLSASIGTGYSGLNKKGEGEYLAGYSAYYDPYKTPIYNPIYSYTSFKTKSFGTQFTDNVNRSIGLNLSIPIFNGFQTQSAVKRAQLNTLNAKISMENAELQLKRNIYQAYSDAQAALKRYYANQKASESLQEAFKYTEQRYNVGMVNAIDFNDAKNKLARSQTDLLQAKFEYIFKLKILDFYQGKPLTLK